MKTYPKLERGHLIQTHTSGAGAIVLERRTEGLVQYVIYEMGIGERVIYPDDISAVGPQLGTIRLHAAKVEA